MPPGDIIKPRSQQAAAAKKPPQKVPVTVADVHLSDFPVYLNGLGTVQPYDTVTVRSRVDGQVTEVGFKQGQMIKEGQVLVQIDPRPYQAALDQAIAEKAQDEASLKDAQLNLARYGALATQEFASKQQFNTQQATVQQLMAQIQGDQAVIDNAQTQVAIPPSALRWRARPVSGWSIRATSCMRPIPPGSSRSSSCNRSRRVHRARGRRARHQQGIGGRHRSGLGAEHRWHENLVGGPPRAGQ